MSEHQLSRKARKALCTDALVANPSQSDRSIAAMYDVSPTSVGKYRAELEAEGKLPPRVDTIDGRKQPVSKVSKSAEEEPEAEVEAAPKPPTRTSELTTSPKFSDEDIRGALELLAICSGNALRASRLTEEHGQRVSPTTLREWARNTHAEWYEELRGRIEPLKYAYLAESFEDLVGRWQDLQKQAAERLEEQLSGASTNETSTIAYRASIAAGVASDKASAHRGRPSKVVAHRSTDEILEDARRKGLLVEGDVEEELIPELEEGDDEGSDEGGGEA
jgi:hypothetical protein